MPYALLFVPSEAIYQFVCAKCDDLFTYALQKHVMLVSPTTLVAEVMTLLSSTRIFIAQAIWKKSNEIFCCCRRMRIVL